MKNNRLPRKLKKRMRNDVFGFREPFPAFFRESIRAAFALSQLMARIGGCMGEYSRAMIRETYPMSESKFPAGGWVMQHNISQHIDEPVIRDSFKNHSVLPVIERLKQSLLTNDDLKRTTDLLRGSYGVVQPNVIRVNETI